MEGGDENSKPSSEVEGKPGEYVILQPRETGVKKGGGGTSLVVQGVRLCAPISGGPGSIPGRGIRSRTHTATKIDPACTPQLRSCMLQLRPNAAKINK